MAVIEMGFKAIVADLVDRIKLGEYPSGSRFPSNEELQRLYLTGYDTVYRVRRRLRDLGWIRLGDDGNYYVC